MRFYLEPNATDPQWLARAAMFHGHLGPWLVTGLLIGRDALERLDTPGHWKIDVTCWMPPDKQRTPFSCILDGLQVSTGATLGKQNIRFEDSEDMLRAGWPVVQVVRLEEHEQQAAGFVYTAGPELHRFFERVTPGRLEAMSRELAKMELEELFSVRAMDVMESAPEDQSSGHTGHEGMQA